MCGAWPSGRAVGLCRLHTGEPAVSNWLEYNEGRIKAEQRATQRQKKVVEVI